MNDMTYTEYQTATETQWESTPETPLSEHFERAAKRAEADRRPRIAARLRRNAEWCRTGDSISSPDAP